MLVVALVCNILVVTVGSWRLARSGHVDRRRIWLLFVLSHPLRLALGGRLVVAELVFVGLLAASLLVAGTAMLWQPLWEKEILAGAAVARSRWLEPGRAALGFLAGMVGIGGGIFLAPLLYMLRWGLRRSRGPARSSSSPPAVGLAGRLPRAAAVRAPTRLPPTGRCFRRCWPAA